LSMFCYLDIPTLESLLSIKKLQNVITSLSLSGLFLPPKHIDLFYFTNWKNLLHLNLQNCKIGPGGVSKLTFIPPGQLVTLNLASNNLGIIGTIELQRLWIWDSLKMLDISHNQIQETGVVILIQPNIHWKSLKYLVLKDNMLNNSAAKYIIERVRWSVSTIDLSDNKLFSQEIKKYMVSVAKQRQMTLLI